MAQRSAGTVRSDLPLMSLGRNCAVLYMNAAARSLVDTFGHLGCGTFIVPVQKFPFVSVWVLQVEGPLSVGPQ